MNHKVSVVTTTLNEKNSIKELLDGLLGQSRRPDEIIIVDGGSKDGTIDVIEDYAGRHNIIRLIVEEGANIARGRNIGVKNASYPYIAGIDAGCRPEKNWLEELIRPFEEALDIDVVVGAKKIESQNDFEFYSGKLMAGGLECPDEKNFRVLGRSVAFKKSIWEKAGGYPEWLYTGEDTLFDEKLRSIGANIVLSKASIVYWRPRKTLWKMAKMFYLYGKGNGHIGTDISGALYHIRNYLIGLVLLLVSFVYPVILLLLVIFIGYFYKGFYRSVINKVKKTSSGWKAEFYVPLIVFIRTLSYCTGLLIGHYEYKYSPVYKKNLELYLIKNQ